MIKNNTILITGANGLIASKTIELLSKSNDYQIYALYRGDVIKKYNNVEYINCDLTDFKNIHYIIGDVNPDILLNCAWFVKHKICWNSYENLTCIAFTMNLIKEFYLKNPKGVFFGIGTFYELLQNETIGQNNYTFSKVKTFEFLRDFCKLNNHNYLWGRVHNIFGIGEPKDKIISYLIDKLKQKQQVTIQNPHNKFDYIYLDDVASDIVSAIDFGKKGDFDIKSGYSATIVEIAYMICDILCVSKDLIGINQDSMQKIYIDNNIKDSIVLKSRLQLMINRNE